MSNTHADFLAKLRFRESTNNYQEVNKPRFLGAYQMGEYALIDAGYYKHDGTEDRNDWKADYWTGKDGIRSFQDYLDNPAVQDKAVQIYHQKVFGYIKGVHQYDGQTLDGIKITVSSLIGGAHLVGWSAESSYLKSDKAGPVPRDGNKTPITEYWSLLSGYDMPFSIDHEKAEKIIGTKGKDILVGLGGDDHIYGGIGKDKIDGGINNDKLFGGDDQDIIVGGEGNDRITGGEGIDVLTGGKGKDTFVFEKMLDAGDKIKDFELGIDKFEIDKSEFGINFRDVVVFYADVKDFEPIPGAPYSGGGAIVYEYNTGKIYNDMGQAAKLIMETNIIKSFDLKMSDFILV